MKDDIKEKLEAAQEKVRIAREDQIQKKAERDSLQTQYDELVTQADSEFGLEPDKLEDHANTLEAEAEELLGKVEAAISAQ